MKENPFFFHKKLKIPFVPKKYRKRVFAFLQKKREHIRYVRYKVAKSFLGTVCLCAFLVFFLSLFYMNLYKRDGYFWDQILPGVASRKKAFYIQNIKIEMENKSYQRGFIPRKISLD